MLYIIFDQSRIDQINLDSCIGLSDSSLFAV